MNDAEKDQRWKIFRALLPYYGRIVSPQFLRKTSTFIPGIERIHPLIEGIYKPAWSDYALSIASMKKNPYIDKLTYLPDGRWSIKYSAKAGGRSGLAIGLWQTMHPRIREFRLRRPALLQSRPGWIQDQQT